MMAICAYYAGTNTVLNAFAMYYAHNYAGILISIQACISSEPGVQSSLI